MKKNKNFKLVLFILILTITYLIVQSTYSKYLTQTDNHSNLNISRWNILLNDNNISNTEVFTENIKLTYENNNSNIASDIIAPTSKAYFDLSLDSTGTDLPFSYEIKIGKLPPCYISLNRTTFDAESSTYLHDIHITVSNSNENTFYFKSFSFEFPESEIILATCEAITAEENQNFSNSSFEGFFSKTPSNPGIDLIKDDSITFNVLLYSTTEIKNFKATNIKLNNLPVEDLYTDFNPDFRITSYTLKDVHYTVASNKNSIKGEVYPPENISDSAVNNFKIFLEWDDNANRLLDNFQDVTISKKIPSATLPVTVIVKQLTPQN